MHWVNRGQIGAVIHAFGYYLLRGLKAADHSLEQLVESLASGNCWMGVAYRAEPFRPMGVWVSELREQDGVDFITIYGVSGEKLPSWIGQAEFLVTSLAQENNCSAMRFMGRIAYKSLLSDLEVIGKTEDGRSLVFEKKIAAKGLPQ